MSERVRLIYWPTLPGRGEFLRWVFAEAGIDWEEPARTDPPDFAVVSAELRRTDVLPHAAPPVVEIDGMRLSQTVAIAHYVATQHGLVGADPADAAHAMQFALTAMDIVDEVHHAHHPISTALYYEDQLAEAKHAAGVFRAQRLPKFLGRFEDALAYSSTPWLAGPERSYADLFLARAVDGLCYAFPVAMAHRLADTPKLVAHRARVHALPRIAAHRASARAVAFNESGLFRHYDALDDLP